MPTDTALRGRLLAFLATVGASTPDDHPWVQEARTLADALNQPATTPQSGERDALTLVDDALKVIGNYDHEGLTRWLAMRGISPPHEWDQKVWRTAAEIRRLLASVADELAEAREAATRAGREAAVEFRERDKLLARLAEAERTIADRTRELAEARAKVERLREVLAERGEHADDCGAHYHGYEPSPLAIAGGCTCGLSAALAPAQERT